jgi:hypothetical protein
MVDPFIVDSANHLRCDSNLLGMIGRIGTRVPDRLMSRARPGPRQNREADMARYEMPNLESAALAEVVPNGEVFFELGMMYSTGRSVPTDLVSAHKWFNIAGMRGNADAVRLRREIADEMSEEEIAAALRAARDWLTRH